MTQTNRKEPVTTAQEVNDVAVIGAGPGGLACAIEAQQNNLNYQVLEKGCLVNSIYHFPANLTLFSTPDLLEIGDIPFVTSAEKPTRSDLLNYYRRVADHYQLKINLFETVNAISGKKGDFQIHTEHASYLVRNIVIAIGQFDNPNYLNVPGEDLEKVSHYYKEPHPYFGKKVAVIGGKNSAVEFALELYKNGVEVTIIHRGGDFGESVKYWILPDIKNRVKEGKIQAYFNTAVKEIKEKTIQLMGPDGVEFEIENDYVLALTGYRPDLGFLKKVGVDLNSKSTPIHDEESLETNVAGIYLAGVITAGCEGSKVFIENSRNHGKKIIGHILNG